ncbi:uncharacterized protein LODBEIA_P06050 [Lodderomyces beijingensis]|uniref:Cas1p 10 TM acyl transferase domain-containing protein n=1 Tax=Lodderomyces beijingensis TaxID=1775926 RepID=A0ABP0ZGW7_9ASCO
MPIWTVWNDIKDFTNYYYYEDVTQVTAICLLALYINSHTGILQSYGKDAAVVVPYMSRRLTLALALFIYSFYIPEHRPQQWLYSSLHYAGSRCYSSMSNSRLPSRSSTFVTTAIGEFL